MASANNGQPAAVVQEEAVVEEAHSEDRSIERLLEHVPVDIARPRPEGRGAAEVSDAPLQAPAAQPGLRTARVVAVKGKEAQIAFRGRGAEVTATIDDGVDRELVVRAMAGCERVLVEVDPEVGPVIVGVVQTRVPETLELKARKVVLDADEELLVRSGRAAMRLREDGDVELVGSRISTLSRGLFRIVGRVLRLN